jgi:hypothetical protein
MGENIKNGRRYLILGYFDSKFKYLLPFLIYSRLRETGGYVEVFSI